MAGPLQQAVCLRAVVAPRLSRAMLTINFRQRTEAAMRLLVIILCALIVAPSFAGAAPAEQNISKAILVTGASSGIGRKVTERLAAQGYFVYATARKDEDLKALGAIRNVQALRLDVTQPADIAAAVEAISKAGRGLHGLVNNAGIGTVGTIADMSFEEFDLCMKVNVYGPVMMIKAFQPLIISQQGRIVNIGSVSGVLAGPGIPAYVMSKHAIEGLTDSLAAQQYASPSQDPEPDEVAAAVEQALFDPSPKRRYLVAPAPGTVERTIRKHIEKLVQLNEGHPYTYERAALIEMLDQALATARPRTQ